MPVPAPMERAPSNNRTKRAPLAAKRAPSQDLNLERWAALLSFGQIVACGEASGCGLGGVCFPTVGIFWRLCWSVSANKSAAVLLALRPCYTVAKTLRLMAVDRETCCSTT